MKATDVLGENMVAVGRKIEALNPQEKEELERYLPAVCTALLEVKKVDELVEKVKREAR